MGGRTLTVQDVVEHRLADLLVPSAELQVVEPEAVGVDDEVDGLRGRSCASPLVPFTTLKQPSPVAQAQEATEAAARRSFSCTAEQRRLCSPRGSPVDRSHNPSAQGKQRLRPWGNAPATSFSSLMAFSSTAISTGREEVLGAGSS